MVFYMNQSMIYSSIGTLTQGSNEMLIPTALHITFKDKSCSDFADQGDLQSRKDMKFLEGKTHRKISA